MGDRAGIREFGALLKAVHFAADRHRDQRRKGSEASPYVNHPIAVAEVLADVGGVDDLVTLQAALLHDTIEDTGTQPEEIEDAFSPEVRGVVCEVTDDKSLPKAKRKELQVEHAPHLSARARHVKLGDKICNVVDLTRNPPEGWDPERRREYLDWTERVIAGCRGTNAALEARYDQVLAAARAGLAREPA
ncbi:MAG: bifunctional (p)ppGpp synthetase/guanosine-3',5'-bis(diphosphate) 3'-pyrophosphohydrolase [Deltaproteobacteria bacterium]|nr:bifunctional (p)ppGpp synthetase/guanosine-3',5'-bis(diphosphate) 3'-pyrophosphohydrolase [Deltaproteobacteria bacterium]MBW2416516.1 bifunctional (p)ppGpp synthetase/guanosine-3',5'-bis(diphosphate) 3'-pyrophosphohydrolase [Deltaproteobacteria bacterium]